jgi:myo-inositol-1(or 4)-monophosphatase
MPDVTGLVVEVLHEAASAVAAALDGLDDWGLAGTRPGQHRSDLVADRAALSVLDAAGFGVVSEESGGHSLDRPVVVVVDPVDGSTNAWRGLPWWATSLCACDRDGPLAAVVVNQATGTRFEAVRGGGSRRDGKPVSPSACRAMSDAIVALSGYPARRFGWNQYRSLGAAALDLCAVACGQLDAFVDCSADALAPWDYLGALLVCAESGAVVVDAYGRDLVAPALSEQAYAGSADGRRAVVAAATPELARAAVEGRLSADSGGKIG